MKLIGLGIVPPAITCSSWGVLYKFVYFQKIPIRLTIHSLDSISLRLLMPPRREEDSPAAALFSSV